MKPITGFKILSTYKEIKNILRGNIVPPRTVEFFISNICNHNCIGCHSKELHETKIPFLKFETAKKVIDECAIMGVEGIELSGGGCPMLYPKIVELARYINEKRLKVGLITNGIPFTKKNIEILRYLLWIRIALDAGTRETYAKVHGKDDFFKLIENIKMIVDYKRKYNLKVTIGLKYLISRHNNNELIHATKLAKKLKVDYLQFKALRKSKECIQQPNGTGLALKRAKELATADFMVIGGVEKSVMKQRCILNMIHPLIDSSGDVYLCAFFQHRKKTHYIGNVHKHPFNEIWYSEKHRQAFLSTDFKECNLFDCPFHPANELVQEAIVKGKMHLEFV